MLGGPAVGKSSLVSQFMTSEYLHAYDTSIGKFITPPEMPASGFRIPYTGTLETTTQVPLPAHISALHRP